jgi:hypothetical protein
MYRNNGEYWYRDRIGPLARLLMWFVHIAGWHMPHWDARGYSYRWHLPAIKRAFRARGHRSWAFALYSSMCPLTLFGGRLVFQPFGVSVSTRTTYYCLHYGHNKTARKRWYAYRSSNSTPWGADTWYFGAPKEVIEAAQAQADRMVDRHRPISSNGIKA